MRSQAQANPNGGARVAIDSPLTEGVIGNLSEFVNDCTTLGELQVRLALLDAQESAARAALPIGLAVAGSVLALASLPVLLLAIGQLMIQYTPLTAGWAYLIVAILGLVIGGLLALLFGLRLGPAFTSFQRSREEFTRNLAWIKTVLAHSGRSPSNRRQTPR